MGDEVFSYVCVAHRHKSLLMLKSKVQSKKSKDKKDECLIKTFSRTFAFERHFLND